MDDRTRWDEKHGRQEGQPLDPPDPFVVAALDRLGPGAGRTALDLACGRGRHVLELARRGFRAEGWDVSPVGLKELERHAAEQGCLVTTRCIDLLQEEDVTAGADLVCVVNFLDRGLFARLGRLLAPGGWLLYRTFTTERPGSKPPVEFCLEPGELARGLDGFETVYERESGGRAGLLARYLGEEGA